VKITIVGTGYVGLVSGIGFADMGNHVTCVDIDATKIQMLNEGRSPIYEPGLNEMLSYNHRSGRLKFTTNLKEATSEADLVFIAVGTPPEEDGSSDLSYVLNIADTLGTCLADYTVVVVKSTVPVGSCLRVKAAIQASADKVGRKIDFDVASNPEFLKEGTAIEDFLRPDRVIIGSESKKAETLLGQLYEPFVINGHPIIFMDLASSEMTKYAANAMLATKISFMNEISRLCERLGADVSQVRRGIGSDRRIGYDFIHAGIGYGGSCFPKDILSLIAVGKAMDEPTRLLDAVMEVNDTQRRWFMNKIQSHFNGKLKGKHFAVWGLAFKPGTDDMRMAPSIDVIEFLISEGATVAAFDPVAMETAQKAIPPNPAIKYEKNAYAAAEAADALLLLTEWREFRRPDFEELKQKMRSPVIFDGRNQYSPSLLSLVGFKYFGIGKKS